MQVLLEGASVENIFCARRHISARRCGTTQTRRWRRRGRMPRRSSSRSAPRTPSCPTRPSARNTTPVSSSPIHAVLFSLHTMFLNLSCTLRTQCISSVVLCYVQRALVASPAPCKEEAFSQNCDACNMEASYGQTLRYSCVVVGAKTVL